MTLVEFYQDAQKAINVLGFLESTAVGVGLVTDAQAGWITAGLGAVASAIVYLSENTAHPTRAAKHEAKG